MSLNYKYKLENFISDIEFNSKKYKIYYTSIDGNLNCINSGNSIDTNINGKLKNVIVCKKETESTINVNLLENRELKTLFDAQINEFPKIIKDLENNYKDDHWIWYVFPNSRPGANALYKIKIDKNDFQDYVYYLNKVKPKLLDEWTLIIENILIIGQNKGLNNSGFSADIGRIIYCLSKSKGEWNYFINKDHIDEKVQKFKVLLKNFQDNFEKIN